MNMGDQRKPLEMGYRFLPTEQELIELLKMKLQAARIPDCVLEKTLYGKGTDAMPWNVFTDADNDKWQFLDVTGKNDAKKVAYVITKLAKMSAKKTSRTAGCGTWDGQTKPALIKNYQGDKIIGCMRCLNYLVDPGYESEAARKGYWYMHEYSLAEDSLKEVGSTDYVICQIIRDDSKPAKMKSSKVDKKTIKYRKRGSGDHNRSPQIDAEVNPPLANCEFRNDVVKPGSSIPQEAPVCYVENQGLGQFSVEGFSDRCMGEKRSSDYNDTAFAPIEMYWVVDQQRASYLGAGNNDSLNYDQYMGEHVLQF